MDSVNVPPRALQWTPDFQTVAVPLCSGLAKTGGAEQGVGMPFLSEFCRSRSREEHAAGRSMR